MKPPELLEELRRLPPYQGQLAAEPRRIPPRPARYGELEQPLPEALRASLLSAGIERFYTHQAEAINRARRGEDVTVVTTTASGKTLCYNVPVIERLLQRKAARALYLFPTKALAQDQLGKLRASGLYALLRPATYDGDTPRAERPLVRRTARVVLSNPDMLHVSVLPHHASWGSFLANLEFVVLDEVHTYRGLFGSHVAAVLRRLARLCDHYGARPQFICCSATIANPSELVRWLTGRETSVVDDDGSPAGAKTFALWNPPLLERESGQRRSANIEATWLFTELVRRGVRNLTFTKARVIAELILRYARQSLELEAPDLVERVAAYRAGYTPTQRREIEQRLFRGDLLGVTATTALELGVDVGDLDACLMVGYPGTIASLWQQAGRAGRARQESLAVLIALDGPLDQFLMRHPDYLFERAPEHAALDPHNPYVLLRQLLCAAHEMPLTEADAALFGAEMGEVAQVLEEAGQLRRVGERWYWAGAGYPAADVDIRSAGGSPYTIMDLEAGVGGERWAVLGTADPQTALQVVYPGAVYLHQGETYLVERLDVESRTAWALRAQVEYYTTPRATSEVRIERQFESRRLGSTACALGEVTVRHQVIGYRRQRLLSETLLATVELDLPPREFRTEALWFVVPDPLVIAAAREGIDLTGAVHALEHAVVALAPLRVMCDLGDLNGASHPNHPDLALPAVFIYDDNPGGAGLADRCYAEAVQLFQQTLDNIARCPCLEGCPSCIQSPKCGSNNQPLDKRGAAWLLERLLAGEEVAAVQAPPPAEIADVDTVSGAATGRL
jgi:DEAD/DEAH box helicase domain-containing protein